jgi:polyisoprenoid-binding protein YceI
MWRILLVIIGALGGLVLAPVHLHAADKYTFDKSHTYIGFEISHMGLSTTFGSFGDFDGTLLIDEQAPQNSKVDVTINAASIDTGHEARDNHLRGADFFNAEKFPTMTFTATKIEKAGEGMVRMTGDLTLLGVTKPILLDVKLNKKGPHPRSGKMMAGFDARGVLKRSDFGMSKGVPMVGDEVALTISTEVQQTP